MPLSRLINLYVAATLTLHKATDTFLGNPAAKVPFVIGIGGSVAVGKSTAARILQALLARWPDHPRVDLVTTDGFLYPNRTLEARGLMQRKGFPESYDVRRLLDFLVAVKAGREHVTAPVYSHFDYDIVPGRSQSVDRPDIMILEGLNVLQTADLHSGRRSNMFVSDFFDFSIYVDAEEADIEEWYVARFMTLRRTVFIDTASYFHRYASLSGFGGGGSGARDLARHQPPQPPRKHPADARARESHSPQRPRSPGGKRPPAETLKHGNTENHGNAHLHTRNTTETRNYGNTEDHGSTESISQATGYRGSWRRSSARTRRRPRTCRRQPARQASPSARSSS